MEHSTSMSGNGPSGGMGTAGAPAYEALGRLSSTAHQTVDRLADGATRAVEKLASQRQWLSEAPPRALASSRSWIQDKPLETVGIALAVGYVVGRLLRH